MTPTVWVGELAARFWAVARDPPPFPRDLTAAATRGLRVSVIAIPDLRLAGVRDRLARIGLPCPADEPDRPLRACLFASRGWGFVFVDAADPPAERRFSLAHEVAHFLRDCDAPRRAAVERLGPAAVEVLDGRRPPTAEERLHAVLRDAPVAAHVHLLRRDDAGRPRTAAEREAEAAADRLAFELLAPAELFAGVGEAELVRRLDGEFGFPPAAAREYAAVLCPPPEPTDAFVERLRRVC